MTSQNSPALLPSGFEDLLPPQAEIEYAAISDLLKAFALFGYRRVKPPLAEFEESLLAPGPGAALAAETFRVMDPVTHRMMGLRSDITAQIARIALSRMGEDERPLRLMYANDVIRTKAGQARTQRQFTQVGCELIGRNDLQADIEICMVALKGLTGLGVGDISIDFALPQISDEILAKDGRALDEVRHDLAGPADKALAALQGLDISAEGQACIAQLQSVVQGVQAGIDDMGLDIRVTVDPLETRGFEYHNGLAFTIFANSIRGELGRGGRYDIYAGDVPQESAAGFTLYMDTLRQALPQQAEKDVKIVSQDASWREVLELQNQGFIVKRG